MKTTNLCLALALCAALTGALRAEEELVLDFGKLDPATILMPFAEKGQTGEPRDLAGRAALRMEWNCAEARWCTVQFRKQVPVPLEGKMRFTLELFREKDSTVRRASLFLVDRDNETFQLVAELPDPTGTWETVTYAFDPENPKANIWGGKVENRIPDPPLRLQGVSCSYKAQHGIESAALGKLTYRPESAPIRAALDTGDELNLVVPGREAEVRLRLRNPGLLPQATGFTYQVRDPDDRELLRETRPVKLDGGATLEIPLPPPERFGVHTVRFLVGDGDLARQEAHRYAYLIPAGPVPGKPTGFLFGVCAHPQRYPPAERRLMARAAGLCGAKLVRSALEAERLIPREGVWTFETYDGIVKDLAENHLEFAPIFLGMPAWADAKDWVPAVDNGSPRGHRPDYRHWEAYVRKFAEHYAPHLRYAEIWNEPDLIPFANFSPDEYLELLKIAGPILRETVPGITLFSAGFASPDLNPPGRSADPAYVRQCVEGGRRYYDLFAVHMHSTPARFRDHYIPELLRFRKELGDATPWHANETGLASYGGITEQYQAETLFINLFRAWSNGAVGYNWYNLRNIRNDPGDPEANYGMLTHNLQPKPVYVAYTTLSRFFRGAELVPQSADGLVFRARDGAWLIPTWREDRERGNALLMVSGILGKASRIDLWGNAAEMRTDNGVLMMENGESPAILRIEGQDTPPLPGGEFFGFDGELWLLPGREQTVAYECRNPSAEPLDVGIAFAPTPGLTVTPAERRFTIPPGGKATPAFAFKLSKDYRSRPLAVKVDAGNLWSGALTLHPESIIPIPADDFGAEPELLLNRPEQVHPLIPTEGTFSHMQWRGPEDLGATVHLARAGDALKIRIKVSDDVHHQPFAGFDVWKADNIQLGLQLPRQKGQWEIGFTRLANGNPEVFVWLRPEGYDTAGTAGRISLATRRDDAAGETRYEAVIPFRAIGLTGEMGREGFQLNVLVNDNDGDGRKNAIAAAPGILKKDPSRFPRFCFH